MRSQTCDLKGKTLTTPDYVPSLLHPLADSGRSHLHPLPGTRMHASISWPAPASRLGLPAFPPSGTHRRHQARVQDVRRWPNHVCNLKEELNRLRGVRLRDVAQLQSAAAAGQTMPLAGGGKWWGATRPSLVHLDHLAMNRGIAGRREQASRTTFAKHAAARSGTADRPCTASS